MFGGFGAGGMYAKYRQGRADAETLPRRTVDHEEFVKLLMAADKIDKEQAERTARIAKAFGSHVKIGEELIAIKRDTNVDDSEVGEG